MMMKLSVTVRKLPQPMTAPCFFASARLSAVTFEDSGRKWLEKSSPPVTAPMMGVMTSPTSEFTIDENAAPMITPMARSTTLPRNANFLNSSSMAYASLPNRHCPAL